MTAERGRKWPWILMAAVLLVTAASIVSDKIKARQGPPDPLPAEVKPWFGPRNQTEALTAADNGVTNARGRLQSAPDEWLRLEMLGRALAARVRISGSYADLAVADADEIKTVGGSPI
ncbi:MAG: hypothetical protein VW935_19870, partial [Novosphingobium sp.]